LVPKVNVVIKNYEMNEKTQRELLPVKREGNIDFSAIVEGARRIRNKLQEDGYFFAEVTETCTVSNPPPDLGPNGTDGNLRESQSDSADRPQHQHRVSGGAGTPLSSYRHSHHRHQQSCVRRHCRPI
jgi:hypothetical protein